MRSTKFLCRSGRKEPRAFRGLDQTRCKECGQELEFELDWNGFVFETCPRCKTHLFLKGRLPDASATQEAQSRGTQNG